MRYFFPITLLTAALALLFVGTAYASPAPAVAGLTLALGGYRAAIRSLDNDPSASEAGGTRASRRADAWEPTYAPRVRTSYRLGANPLRVASSAFAGVFAFCVAFVASFGL